MSAPVDTGLYFAKASKPANGWRTPMLPEAEAVEKAEWFVRQWKECGFAGEATVFYRDGSIHRVVNAQELTEGVE